MMSEDTPHDDRPTTDEAPPRSELHRLRRRIKHKLRAALLAPLKWLMIATVPRIYLAYMWLVYATSKVDPGNFPELHDWIREYDGAVGVLWHEEVFTVAYGYHYLHFRPHTLASVGTSGEVIARMLDLCGFVTFRGGSSRRVSRRRTGVLSDMTEHMKQTREVIYGITVDGSRGPAYRLKQGSLVIARECKRPVILARTWYKRSVRLWTWDRTAIPLPFNEIRYYLAGPYPVPDDAHTQTGFERFRLRVEDDLIDLAVRSYQDLGLPLPGNLVKRSPEERAELLEAAAQPAAPKS